MKQINKIPTEWNDISLLFIAIGDEQRQRILLTFEKDERMNIMQIVANSKLSRSAVTHHLNILKQSGALNSEKVGKDVFFSVNKELMIEKIEAVLQFIKDNN